MLYTQKLLAELERKREQFTGYHDRYGRQLNCNRSIASSSVVAHTGAFAQVQRGRNSSYA